MKKSHKSSQTPLSSDMHNHMSEPESDVEDTKHTQLESMNYADGVALVQPHPLDHGIKPPGYGQKKNTYWDNKLEGKNPQTGKIGEAPVKHEEAPVPIDLDTTPLPIEISKQFYAHGGFMGAAPELLADTQWRKILFALMPDVERELTQVMNAGEHDVGKLIIMMENNPVMSAYGMWQTQAMDEAAAAKKEADNRVAALQAFEWDVFVPDDAVNEYDYQLLMLGEATKSGDDARAEEAEAELTRLDHRMVDGMLIAHGASKDLLLEKIGAKQHSSVATTKKTEYGGLLPVDWMDMFGRALLMAGADKANFDKLYSAHVFEQQRNLEDDAATEQIESGKATFKEKMTIGDVVSVYKTIFKKDRFSVMLDIKSASLRSSAICRMAEVLNLWGIHVLGVGSFDASQLEGLENVEQVIGGEVMAPIKQVHFFHYISDFAAAVGTPKCPYGSDAMFNGAMLIEQGKADADGTPTYTERIDQSSLVAGLAYAYKLKLGIYVQENDIAPQAVSAIESIASADTYTYTLGFAWGGMTNAAATIKPTEDKERIGLGSQGNKLLGMWLNRKDAKKPKE